MFGIDSSELAIIALVALLVIGPKDLPRVMRQVGQWMAKGRAMTRHVRAGFDTMMREAEMEEMQAQWAAQNEAIMKATALPDLGIRSALPDYGSDISAAPLMTPEPSGAGATETAETVLVAPPPKARRSRARAVAAPTQATAPAPAAAESAAPMRKRRAKPADPE
jgi:sec-independent protein translocase protein TatB